MNLREEKFGDLNFSSRFFVWCNMPKKKIIEVVAAIVRYQGKYMVCSRPKHTELGKFLEFPGGKVEPGETPAAAAAVRENFERRSPLLGITVSHSVLDRVRESLVLLETQARTDAPADYASTLALLRELVREIARLEKLSATNIL